MHKYFYVIILSSTIVQIRFQNIISYKNVIIININLKENKNATIKKKSVLTGRVKFVSSHLK